MLFHTYHTAFRTFLTNLDLILVQDALYLVWLGAELLLWQNAHH
jgi:hypothetical protein